MKTSDLKTTEGILIPSVQKLEKAAEERDLFRDLLRLICVHYNGQLDCLDEIIPTVIGAIKYEERP